MSRMRLDDSDNDDEELAVAWKSSSSASSDAANAFVKERAAQAAIVKETHDTHVSSFLPFVEKYRPERLEDLTGQNDIVQTIIRLIDVGRLPHLLFYGPPGTGKTSTILAIARRLYGSGYKDMVLELNASDDRGIDVVREQIKDFAGTRKLFSTGVKLIILDEADAMTHDAQFALRRVIEKYTKNTRFCLIGNYVSKIIPALQSRCTKFRFSPLRKEQIEGKLRSIVDREGLSSRVSADGIEAILRLSNGDMRKVLNVLQATSSGFAEITTETVHACTGQPLPSDIQEIHYSLMNDDFEKAFETLQRASHTKGLSMVDIVTEISRVSFSLRLPPDVHVLIADRLADIEYRLAFGTNDKIQGASLIAVFAAARDLMKKYAPS
jgi:replication factor C subunit 3/5